MSEPLSKQRLEEIEAREKAATSGPWEWCEDGVCLFHGWDGVFAADGWNYEPHWTDMQFIAKARGDLPAMIDAWRRQRGALSRIRTAIADANRDPIRTIAIIDRIAGVALGEIEP